MEEFKIPYHVGIILDGNGRWASEKGLKRSEGHKEGFETLKRISPYILEKGVKELSVYAFSTENFKRTKEEVSFLMNLFIDKFTNSISYFNEKNIKVVFSGIKDKPLPKKVIKAMNELEENTKNNTKGTINICLNYGGHAEIIDATKKIVKDIEDNKLNIDNLNEETYNSYLYQDMKPIDLLIRTSGEQRISNFMLWQIAYAEMYFTKVNFPDFNEEEFDKALIEYNKRNRRFGKNK